MRKIKNKMLNYEITMVDYLQNREIVSSQYILRENKKGGKNS